MAGFFSKIKNKMSSDYYDEHEESPDYVEVDQTENTEGPRTTVRSFTLEDFEDIKPILDAMRNGNFISLVNIRPLKEKDMLELKRSVSKLKKTCEAVEGDIAGFDDDWIVIVPKNISIYKAMEATGDIENY